MLGQKKIKRSLLFISLMSSFVILSPKRVRSPLLLLDTGACCITPAHSLSICLKSLTYASRSAQNVKFSPLSSLKITWFARSRNVLSEQFYSIFHVIGYNNMLLYLFHSTITGSYKHYSFLFSFLALRRDGPLFITGVSGCALL